MSLSPVHPPKVPSARRALFWIALTLLLPTAALVGMFLGLASYFRLSSDSRALRNGLMEASGVEWRRQINLNIGSLTFAAVRAGLAFIPLDPEARAAIQTARSAEVGIYQLVSAGRNPDGAAMLDLADRVLSARGWERVVGAMDNEKLVGVYLPAKSISARRVKCCVMVFDGDRMIVVRATANLEPLLQCLQKHVDLHGKLRTLAAR
jgi:hypothetical protein